MRPDLTDGDGYRWTPISDDLYTAVVAVHCVPVTREHLEKHWGPITEVSPAEKQ